MCIVFSYKKNILKNSTLKKIDLKKIVKPHLTHIKIDIGWKMESIKLLILYWIDSAIKVAMHKLGRKYSDKVKVIFLT